MSKGQITFVIFYIVCIVLTLSLKTSLGVVIMLFTLGLGAALFYIAPNVAIYGLPVLLYIAMTNTGVSKLYGRMVCIAIIGLIAFLPAFQSSDYAREKAAELSREDVARSTRVNTRHIELHQPFVLSAKRHPAHQAACGPLCQKLLITSHADTVTVLLPRHSMSMSYRFGEQPSCQPSVRAAKLYLPYTKWLGRRGRCIFAVPQSQVGGKALIISLLTARERFSYIDGIGERDMGEGERLRRLEIRDPNEAPSKQLIVRTTEFSAKVVSFPFRINLEGDHGMWFKYAVARDPLVVNAIDVEKTLKAQLDLDVSLPDSGQTSEE